MSIQRQFNGTCETLTLLGCDSSIYYVDPCDCRSYYQCVNSEMLTSDCTVQTLWDPETNNCGFARDILLRDDCDDPWTRCNVTETRLLELEALCTNTTVPLPSSTTPSPSTTLAAEKQDGGGINPGLAIGLIVAGAVLAVIIIAAVFFYLRHRRRTTIKKGRGTIASNPEYFEGGNEHDPYDFINDVHMHDPAYQGQPSGGFPSNGTLTSQVHTGTLEGTAVYDNSASRESDPSSGYTDTLPLAQREREQPYERPISRTRDGNANEIDANTPGAKQAYENRGITDDNGEVSSAGPMSSVGNTGADGALSVTDGEVTGETAPSAKDDDKPDYYTLTKTHT